MSDKELIERLSQRTAEYVESSLARPADHDALEAASRLQALVADLSRAQEEIGVLRRDKQEWRQSAMELQADLNRIREWMKSRAYKDGAVLSVEICDLDEEAVGDWGQRIDAAINAATGGGSLCSGSGWTPREHAASKDCWCGPAEVEGGIWVHNYEH